jgi:hypothetical protein
MCSSVCDIHSTVYRCVMRAVCLPLIYWVVCSSVCDIHSTVYRCVMRAVCLPLIARNISFCPHFGIFAGGSVATAVHIFAPSMSKSCAMAQHRTLSVRKIRRRNQVAGSVGNVN